MAMCGTPDLLWQPSQKAEIRRYVLAAVAVLTLGACAALTIAGRPQGQVAASDVEDAVILDLPPALSSSAPPSDAAEGPEQQAMTAVAPTTPPKDETVREPLPPPAPNPAAAIETPKPPVADAAAQEAMAPAGSQAPVPAAEPIDSAAAARHAGHAISLWQRAMLTRLERAKSGTHAGGLSGTVLIAFTIDRAGHLLSSRIARGSGSARLDEVALGLLTRASPFPSPPPKVVDRALVFTVPITFARR